MFSCFALADSFSAVPRAPGPVFMFCAPGVVFGGAECVTSRFHVLPGRTRFSAVPRASGPVFMFCAPRRVFGDVDCVRSRFHVLYARTHFRRYRGHRVPLSCLVLRYSFSTVPSASGPVFMFCAPGIIFGGTEGVRSRFHVLCSQTRFRRCRVRRVPFSCFARPESFSAVSSALGPVFMFCAPRLIFDSTRASCPVFMICSPGLLFGGTEGVGPRIHVLRSQTHFRRYRGRRVQYSCSALIGSFSAVPRASGPFFMFCAPGLIFRARTRFRRYRGRRVPF
jgi:hypothetical protein